MPRIFDNIEKFLSEELGKALKVSYRSDFCVGYFNLRGWKHLNSFVDKFEGGEGKQCRLLIGMNALPQEELKELYRISEEDNDLDNSIAVRLKQKVAKSMRDQLSFGVPTTEDENGLRRLSKQLRNEKLKVKLHLSHRLHAKLYLCFRDDAINPTMGYLGSSNLTMAGLKRQGELNIDVLDHDACEKLSSWFEARWEDMWCLDISEALADIIDESWAREELIPPHHIYVKMAYHLSQEALAGLAEFKIPKVFGKGLFDYQIAAVRIAARHLNVRHGVLIGDVVGLGKTLMATALAKIFEEDFDHRTLIICPKNLVKMWEYYAYKYRLNAYVLSRSKILSELSGLPRYKTVLIDESHNFRNRKGKMYKALDEYISTNESRCILLSATPYNKTYLDLSSQLRLFIPEEKDLGIRPEKYIKQIGVVNFNLKHQVKSNTILAFEKSEFADDWRELMRLFLVRRTRSFIKQNYAELDPENQKMYLTFEDGERSYFPDRTPLTLKYKIDENDPDDQYAKLYSQEVVDDIASLHLPRYGLGNYIITKPVVPTIKRENEIIDDLSRAGKRLMGFCRTNLFKRLESSGEAFILSLRRHVLRNYIYIHAIENDKEIPIGTQDVGLLDAAVFDEDADSTQTMPDFFEAQEGDETDYDEETIQEVDWATGAEKVYNIFDTKYRNRFKWLRSSLFEKQLKEELLADAMTMISILEKHGSWNPDHDNKLIKLHELLTKTHPKDKILVFTQFADTVRYLSNHLKKMGVKKLEGVSGQSHDPTEIAWRFSPKSNEKSEDISSDEELRVVISTDVLSEGQNLQDSFIVVNYDIPWAIVRLTQRVGRVDRIGQKSEKIYCYSFLPADGIEKILRLRARVDQRLKENAEVVGTDEVYFEGDTEEEDGSTDLKNLYNEKGGILDGDDEGEIDLASYAYQIWKNAITDDPSLKNTIPSLPDVVYTTKGHVASDESPDGALVYMKNSDGNDAFAWINEEGESVTESQYQILRKAECEPDEPAIQRREDHHDLVLKGVKLISEERRSVGGQLGKSSSARYKTYVRLKEYRDSVKETLFDIDELKKAINDIYRYPLRQRAIDALNRHLRSGVNDVDLVKLVITLRKDDNLCMGSEDEDKRTTEPQIICSMGLKAEGK